MSLAGRESPTAHCHSSLSLGSALIQRPTWILPLRELVLPLCCLGPAPLGSPPAGQKSQASSFHPLRSACLLPTASCLSCTFPIYCVSSYTLKYPVSHPRCNETHLPPLAASHLLLRWLQQSKPPSREVTFRGPCAQRLPQHCWWRQGHGLCPVASHHRLGVVFLCKQHIWLSRVSSAKLTILLICTSRWQRSLVPFLRVPEQSGTPSAFTQPCARFPTWQKTSCTACEFPAAAPSFVSAGSAERFWPPCWILTSWKNGGCSLLSTGLPCQMERYCCTVEKVSFRICPSDRAV